MSTESIQILTPDQLLAAAEANPAKFVTLRLRKKSDIPRCDIIPEWNGVKYSRARYVCGLYTNSAGEHRGNPLVSRGLVNPSDKSNLKSRYANTRMSQSFRVSQLGDFGKVMVMIDAAAERQLGEMHEAKLINMEGKVFSGVTGTKNEKYDHTDPYFSAMLDFSKYPEDFFLKDVAGKSKSIVLDASKQLPTSEDGYAEATVIENGKAVSLNEKNAFKFFVEGCRLIYAEFEFSLSISEKYASIKVLMTKALVAAPAKPMNKLRIVSPDMIARIVTGEDNPACNLISDNAETPNTSAVVAQPAPQPAAQPEPPLSEDDVADLLGSLTLN